MILKDVSTSNTTSRIDLTYCLPTWHLILVSKNQPFCSQYGASHCYLGNIYIYSISRPKKIWYWIPQAVSWRGSILVTTYCIPFSWTHIPPRVWYSSAVAVASIRIHCQVDHCDARGVAKPAALGIAHRGSGPWRSTCLTYQWATGKWSEVDEVDDGMNFCIHLFIYLIHLPLFSWNGIILHLFQYRLVKWGGEMASTCGCRWYGNAMPWRGVSWATTESAITTAIRTATTRDNPQERQVQHLEPPQQHHHHHHFFVFCYIPVQHANCKLADATMTMCPWFNHSNRKASNVQLCFFGRILNSNLQIPQSQSSVP